MPLLLRQPRTSQPQGPAPLDPAYGLTHFVCGDGYFDRQSKGMLAPTNGPVRSVNQDGQTFTFAKASAQRLNEAVNVSIPSKYSFIALFNSTGTDTNYSSVFNFGGATTYSFQLRHTTTQWNFFHRDTTTDKLAAGTYTAGRHIVIGTWDGLNMRLYIDGVLVATTAVTTMQNTTATYFNIGSDFSISSPVASSYWDGSISLVGIALGTAWIDLQVKALTANPWQIFAPQSRQIWVPSDVTGAFFTSLIEAATAADASSIVAALSRTASEPGTATDTVNGVGAGSYTGTASESTTATDATSEVFGATGIASESGTATDAADRTLATFASVAESGTATDAASQIAAMSGTVAESTSATDSAAGAGAGAYNGSTAETVSAADTVSQVAALSGSASETATATDTASQVAALSATVTESVSASDLAAAAKAVQALIAEALTAVDSVSAAAAGAYLASLTEGATALDTQSQAAAMFGSLAEAATATDFAAVYKAWVVTIVDNAAANDLISAVVADAIKRLFVTDIAVLTLPSSLTVTDTPSSIVVMGQSSDIYVR